MTPLGSTYPRVATVGGFAGVSILKGLEREKNYRELTGVRALKLGVKDGRVSGAYCFDKAKNEWFFINAKCVVVATGGFSSIYRFSTNGADLGGDGIAMCLDAGATLVDLEFIQFEPTVAVDPPALVGKSMITTLLFEGATIRNGKGRPLADDWTGIQKDGLARMICREIQSGNAGPHGGVFFDATGVDPALLRGKYKSYLKRYADVGIDLTRQYAEIAPAPHTTMGGVRIDPECKTDVEGLFACGEVSGGIHGANRLGGNAGLEVVVFGKIAGRSAAAYAKRHGFSEEIAFARAERKEDAPTDRRAKMEDVLEKSLNVIRNARDLSDGAAVVSDLLQKTPFSFCYESARLHNDLLCALAAISAAAERKGSVGAHFRSDGIEETEKYALDVTSRNDRLTVKRRMLG